MLAAVFAHWEQLVGPEIAAHAEPRSLRAGVLLLAVDQSGWATQLRYLAPDLLGRLRLATGATEITEIQIRAAPPARRPSRFLPPAPGVGKGVLPVGITPLWYNEVIRIRAADQRFRCLGGPGIRGNAHQSERSRPWRCK